MPTDRPQLEITVTDDIAAMLDLAARRWPEERSDHARLLVRLAAHGAEALVADRRRWAEMVRGVGGAAGPGSYPPGYLDQLRGEWPDGPHRPA